MSYEYQRNLRGQELAKEVQRLNGHQQEFKFVFFHPIWFAMIVASSLTVAMPPLIYFLYIGAAGTLFEAVLWGVYYFRTRDIKAYPGITAWADIQVRRFVMNNGRLASRLGLPH